MSNKDVLLEIWKVTRETINHLDIMMDGVRIRTYTFSAAISSIAAALYYYYPESSLFNVSLSVLIELILIPIIIILYAQNRMYHFWLYRAIDSAINIEEILYNKYKNMLEKKDVFITYSLTKIDVPRKGYWHSMRFSKIFWMDTLIFSFLILFSLSLAVLFGFRITLDP